MYAVCVTFAIKLEMMEQFMPLMHQQAKNSLELETACHQFDVCTDPDRPSEVFLYEIYEDATAFQLHLESGHFQQFNQAVTAMIEKKTVTTYSVVNSDRQ